MSYKILNFISTNKYSNIKRKIYIVVLTRVEYRFDIFDLESVINQTRLYLEK